MNYSEFTLWLLPELILLLTALAVIGFGCLRRKSADAGTPDRVGFSAILSGIGLVLAGGVLLFISAEGRLADGALVLDPLTRLFKLVLIVLSLVAVGFLRESPPIRHSAENFAMLLFATIGLLLVVGTEELLVLFLALELAALSLYVMVGFTKSDPRSAEAAFKYFIFGSVAAAFLLYGFSLIFGYTGSSDLPGIGLALRNESMEPILAVGLVMALVGFGFKAASVPFHLWSPDVYQGAPVPAAALIASGSKVAGFFILAKFLLLGFSGAEGAAGWGAFAAGWVPLIAVMAALSMVVGNLAALAQTSVRRLLAYSGIGHAGFMLIALMAATPEALSALLFYVVIYAFATLGAFGVVTVVLRNCHGDHITDFVGMGKRAPFLSLCMLFFFASLAGLPPLAGFFGKFFLFTSAMGAPSAEGGLPGMLWLVLLALFMSAVSLYYYLKVVQQMFFAPIPADSTLGPVVCSRTLVWIVALLAAAVFILGCVPDLLLAPIERALAMFPMPAP